MSYVVIVFKRFRVFSECFFDKMVNCRVPGSTNYSAKSRNISYHKIPKDPQLQKAWISRLRRENLPSLKNCYVCSEHFDNECFEYDFMEQLIGEKKRKRLKADAIPNIFPFTSPTAVSSKRRATTEYRIERKRQKEVRCYVIVNFHHAANVNYLLFLYQTLENILAPSSSGSFADAKHKATWKSPWVSSYLQIQGTLESSVA